MIWAHLLSVLFQIFNSEAQTRLVGKRSLDSEAQTLPVGKRSLDSEAQTLPVGKRGLDSEVQTLPVGKRGLDSEVQTLPVGKRSLDSEVQTLPVGKRSLDSEAQTLPVGKRSLDSEAQTLPVGKRSLDSEVQTLPVGKRGLDSEAQTLPVGERSGNLDASKCDKSDVKRYHEECLEKGYPTKLGETCESLVADVEISKFAIKRCGKIENRLKKCGYSCDIDGGWSEYGDWSECSAECGGGESTRIRVCNNPAPAGKGADCEGDTEETKSCNTHVCVVDGQFGDWTDWTECSEECGPGLQSRTRECNNPAPSGGGRYCDGYKIETRLCQNEPCQLNPDTIPSGSLYKVGNWTKCSMYSVCGQAKKYRIIEITEEDTCTFTSCSEWQPLQLLYDGGNNPNDRFMYNRYKLGRKTTPFHLQTRGLTRRLRLSIDFIAFGDDEREVSLSYEVGYAPAAFTLDLMFNSIGYPGHHNTPQPLVTLLDSRFFFEDPLATVPSDYVKDWTIRVTDHPGFRIDCNGVTIYDVRLTRDELYRIARQTNNNADYARQLADLTVKRWEAEGENFRLRFRTYNHLDRNLQDVAQTKIRIGE